MISIRAIAGRILAALVVASMTTSLPQAAKAAAPFQKTQSTGFFRMTLGSFEVTAIYDGGDNQAIKTGMLHGKDGEVVRLIEKSLGNPDKIEGAVMAFLVNTDDKLILVDTGAGGHWGGPALGKLMTNFAATGYRPDQVDIVLLTHLHADHAGGLTSLQGVRNFPNAEVRVAKADSDFWLSEVIANKAPADFRIFFKTARDVAAPYVAAGKWHPFEGAAEIVPGVKARPLPGHTPGHSGYEFTSNGEKMLVWGDVVHVASVQLPDPSIYIDFDADSPAAVKARIQLFKTLAADRTIVAGAHMPFPGLGRLRNDGTGYAWLPVLYSDR